jgi:hypothetical protein
MRTLAAATLCLLCLLSFSRPSLAEPAPSPEARYQQQKKNVPLAITLEVLCPIAGAGALYAGAGEMAIVLAARSAMSAVVAVGSTFYLIYLSHQHPTGAGRVLHDIETVTAWTGLISSGALYLLTRVAGVALAPDAVTSFNDDLQQRLGLPPPGLQVPFRAQVTGLSLTWHF